jgi:hypothetical protein
MLPPILMPRAELCKHTRWGNNLKVANSTRSMLHQQVLEGDGRGSSAELKRKSLFDVF